MEQYQKNHIFDLMSADLKGGNDEKIFNLFVLHESDNLKDFIESRQADVSSYFQIIFHRSPRINRDDYILYRCERGRKPRGRSVKKAVGCTAFVSFKTKKYGKYVGITETINNKHCGHDYNDENDKSCSTIDQELVYEIEKLLKLGVKNEIILSVAHAWARSKGHLNAADRRFYVTPQDISEIRRRFMSESRLDRDDATSVHLLLTTTAKDHVIMYQPSDENRGLPFIAVLQTSFMRTKFIENGRNLVFLDATHSLTQYGFALYTICVRDEFGYGVPVVYIISSSESDKTLGRALKNVRDSMRNFVPRAFMVDKDVGEWNAIEMAYPESKIFLCWFHVTQAIYRWMMSNGSGLSGTENQESRKEIIVRLDELKCQKTLENFLKTKDNLLADYCQFPELTTYLKENWISIGEMWADFGRQFFHEEAETNNFAERFFLRLKHQFLHMNVKRRLDDLIQILLGNVMEYFEAKQQLLKSGRIKSKKEESQSLIQGRAEKMLACGWSDKIRYSSSDPFLLVDSESKATSYKTVPGELYCECAFNRESGRICKHLELYHLLSEDKQLNIPELDDFHKIQFKSAIDCQSYEITSDETGEIVLTSPSTGMQYMANVLLNMCTCNTFSHLGDCVCLNVAKHVCSGVRAYTDVRTSSKYSDIYPASNNMQDFALGDVGERGDSPMEDSHSEDTLPQKKLELLRKVEYIAAYITKSSAVSSDVSKPLEHVYLRITGKLKKKSRAHKLRVLNQNRRTKRRNLVSTHNRILKKHEGTSERKRKRQMVSEASVAKAKKLKPDGFDDSSRFKRKTKKISNIKKRRIESVKKQLRINKKVEKVVLSKHFGDSLVPKDVKVFLEEEKKRVKFPSQDYLQVAYANGIIEKLKTRLRFIPDECVRFRTVLITFFNENHDE